MPSVTSTPAMTEPTSSSLAAIIGAVLSVLTTGKQQPQLHLALTSSAVHQLVTVLPLCIHTFLPTTVVAFLIAIVLLVLVRIKAKKGMNYAICRSILHLQSVTQLQHYFHFSFVVSCPDHERAPVRCVMLCMMCGSPGQKSNINPLHFPLLYCYSAELPLRVGLTYQASMHHCCAYEPHLLNTINTQQNNV